MDITLSCVQCIEILSLFVQEDLSDDDVMILDNGTNVFVWFGKNSSEMERRLAVRSCQVCCTVDSRRNPLKRNNTYHTSQSDMYRLHTSGFVAQ